MKIIVKDLREYLDASGLSIVEIVRRMNDMQAIIAPQKREITKNFIYFTLKGHTPRPDNIYILASVLKVHPKKLFTIVYDDLKYEEYQKIYRELFT